MPTFKSVKELEEYLQEQIMDSLKTDVAEKTIELEKEHVKIDVYKKYKPKEYVRRKEDGGLLDDENYLVEEIENGIKISNITRDNGYATPSDPDRYVAPIVEDGVGYTWEDSEIYQMQPYPRPFIKETRKDLKKGKLKEFMKKALEKRFGKGAVI